MEVDHRHLMEAWALLEVKIQETEEHLVTLIRMEDPWVALEEIWASLL